MNPAEASATAEQKSPLRQGELISNRFRVLDVIGEGGFGVVYAVEHIQLKKKFALKLLHQHLKERSKMIERLRLEAISASKIVHPNIVNITDIGSTETGQIYYVMELLKGYTLKDLLHRVPILSPSRALPILFSICQGLAAAHEVGIIHRDLKPSNIFLIPQDNLQGTRKMEMVKILDFGLAKNLGLEAEKTPLTTAGKALGTLGYVAPEQLQCETVDERSDLYSLGCIAFEMFVGRPVFIGRFMDIVLGHIEQKPPKVTEVNSHALVIPRLEQLIDCCLEKDRQRRPKSAREILEELREIARIMLTPEGNTWVGMTSSRATGQSDDDNVDTLVRDDPHRKLNQTGQIGHPLAQTQLAQTQSFDVFPSIDLPHDATVPMPITLYTDHSGVEGNLIVQDPHLEMFSFEESPTIGTSNARPVAIDETNVTEPMKAKPFQVMLIESDQELAAQIAHTIKKAGYSLLWVEGKEAVQKAQEQPPDLILLSVELHRLSGFTICSQLKKDPILRHVPLVLMSFDTADEVINMHKTLVTRADAYLLKPFSKNTLLETVEPLFDKKVASIDDLNASSSRHAFHLPNDNTIKLNYHRGPFRRSNSRRSLQQLFIAGLALVTLVIFGLALYFWQMSITTQKSSATLVLQVNPTDAYIQVQGHPVKQVGHTRLIENIEAGQIHIKATHLGCAPQNQQIVLKPKEVKVVTIQLECEINYAAPRVSK